MDKKVLNYIRQNRMLAMGDGVIVALSGGADSVCLLVVLNELKKILGIRLMAVHIHHGLRGKEADRDSYYAKELSDSLGIPFACVQVDAAACAKSQKISVEEAGRRLRYEILEQKRQEFGGEKIAVAHHGDDQAETILYHLFRGSGLKGLGGIRPVRDRIIRPLLCADREEILAYLKEKGIPYCEDSTNQSLDYTRNRLRHQILPEVKEQINSRAVENILHAGEMAAKADVYFEKQADAFIKEHGSWQEDENGKRLACRVKEQALLEEEEILRSYVIRRMIEGIQDSMKDITLVHVESAAALLLGPCGKRVDLPYALTAEKSSGELWIKKKQNGSLVENRERPGLPEPKYTVFLYKKGQEIPKNGYTKWFDYDKIKCTLSIRYRQTGDYITLAGGKRKTVKAFMIDEKIPRQERDRIPLVAEGSHILWIAGYRISEYYKITNDTKTVLQIQLNGGKDNGR